MTRLLDSVTPPTIGEPLRVAGTTTTITALIGPHPFHDDLYRVRTSRGDHLVRWRDGQWSVVEFLRDIG